MMAITGGTWTYSGDPSIDNKDAVRFVIGDTDTANQQISDEEILWMLTQHSNVYEAGSVICISLAGNYARLSDKSVGDLKISQSNQAKAYLTQAQALMDRAHHDFTLAAAPYNASQSVSEVQAAFEDTDRNPPAFMQGQTDNPQNPQQTVSGSTGLPGSDPSNV